MLVLTYQLIYSFETALYKFAPYILSLIDKQVFFLSVILVEILNFFLNNHTGKDLFVPMYWGGVTAYLHSFQS